MKSKLLIVYRLYNPVYGENGNPCTLHVYLKEDNTIRYSLFGGWQDSGIGHAIFNLGLRKSLPISARKFDKLEDLDLAIKICLETGYGSHVIKTGEVINDLNPFIQTDEVNLTQLSNDIVEALYKKGKLVQSGRSLGNSGAVRIVNEILNKNFKNC